MKKYLALFIVLVVAFTISTSVTQAENSSTYRSAREEMKQKIEGLRAKIKDERDTAKARIKEVRITGRENSLQRFDFALERIINLKERINNQIIKLKEKGINVTNAKNFLEIANTKLDGAEEKITEINKLLTASIDELTLENKTKLRTLAMETQTLLKDAHLALNDSIKSLKDEVKVKLEKGNEEDD